MSNFVNDVKFLSTTAGTASFTIGTAVSGFQKPSTAQDFISGVLYSYSARTHAGQFESGSGINNGITQARTIVNDGSDGAGVKVNFSDSPTVVLTVLSGDMRDLVAESLIVSGVGSIFDENLDGTIPLLVNIYDGSVGFPITDQNCSVSIARVESTATNNAGGQNPALQVLLRARGSNPASHEFGQGNAIKIKAVQQGFGDIVGLYSQTFIEGQGDDCVAYGGYFDARAQTASNGAVSVGAPVFNNTGSDIPFSDGVLPTMTAFDAVSQGGKLVSSVINTRNGGNTFDTVLGINSQSVRTTIVANYAATVALWQDFATHTDGIDLSTATFTGFPFKSPGFSIDGIGNINGGWTSFTSTATPGAGAITTQTSDSYYIAIGKLILVTINVSITTVGTASGSVTLSLPVTPNNGAIMTGRENGVSGKMIQLVGSGSLFNYDNSNVSLSNGANYLISGVYRAA